MDGPLWKNWHDLSSWNPLFFSNQKSFTFLLRWTIIIINFPQKLQEITLMIRVWWQRTRHLTQKILRLCWWDKEALQIRVGVEKRIETQLFVIEVDGSIPKSWFLFWLSALEKWFLGQVVLEKALCYCLLIFCHIRWFLKVERWCVKLLKIICHRCKKN